MSERVEVDLANGQSVSFEVDSAPEGKRESSGGGEALGSFEKAIGTCSSIAETAIDGFSELGIDELEVEFGLKASLEVGGSFWVVAKASREANLRIKVKWKAKDGASEVQ